MKKFIFLIVLCCLSKIIFAQTLRFATEATYPPFEYVDEHGKMQGFDVAIVNAICAELNTKCEFSNQSFNSLMPSLALGKFDAVIAAIGVTPEREKVVDFTQSYYQPSASFVVKNNHAINLNKLKGRIIGVQQGSTFEKYLNDKYGANINIKSYASMQDAFLDLNAERIDLALTDTPIALTWLNDNNNKAAFHVIGQSIVDENYFGSGYAIAVKKNNKILLDAFNQALLKIKANGIYDKIAKKYFNASAGQVS